MTAVLKSIFQWGKMRYLVLFFITIGFFCKHDIDRSMLPYYYTFLNPKKSANTITIIFSPNTFSLSRNIEINTIVPTVSGTIQNCSASFLPAGLSLNALTCAISGTPTTLQEATTHTITASNSDSSTTANIIISVISFPN